jgi:hypothetical protein
LENKFGNKVQKLELKYLHLFKLNTITRVCHVLIVSMGNKSSKQAENRFGLDELKPSSTGQVTVNLIFVHGLGGSARGTWTHPKNARAFWPAWLSEIEDLKDARVFAYGYDADWLAVGRPNTTLNISNFGTQLLNDIFLRDLARVFRCMYFSQGNRNRSFLSLTAWGVLL